MSSSIFARYSGKFTTIVLVDASGSTIYNDFGNLNVLHTERKVIESLEGDEFYLIFWNSNHKYDPSNQFVNGIYKVDSIVKKSELESVFNRVQPMINQQCLTFPHLAFEAIPDDWICADGQTRIYLITDGEMGYRGITNWDKISLKNELGSQIERLFMKFSNVRMHIITVEPKKVEYKDIENMSSAAGSDVFDVVMNKKLTRYISKFTSFSLNHPKGFVHISKNIPAPGCIPYIDQYFSEFDTGKFIVYIKDQIDAANNCEELLQIVQNLAPTITYLTMNKPLHRVNDIVMTFSNMFKETEADMSFVQFILDEAVANEKAGTATVYASYRAKMRDLFANANSMLHSSVKKAINITGTAISFPIDGKIISVHHRMVIEPTTFFNVVYPQSSANIDGIVVPFVPMERTNFSQMNDQCLRQWIRQIVSKMDGENAFDDIIIYLVLAYVLVIVVSEVDNKVKLAYRELGATMLRKKRAKEDVTEVSKLQDGHLPIPNSGKIEDFHKYMAKINTKLDLNLRPMTLWYALCLALDDPLIISKQLIHCKSDIESDFINCDPKDLLTLITGFIKPVVHININSDITLDYKCPVTEIDTSLTGGYRFVTHNNIQGTNCCPSDVLSEEGYATMIADSNTLLCPICYTSLTPNDFSKVGPKATESITIFQQGTGNIFAKNSIPIPRASAFKAIPNVISNSNNSSTTKPVLFSTPPIGKLDKRTVLIMRGTVGSGKTTYAHKLKQEITNKGWQCLIASPDKYSKAGIDRLDIPSMIKTELAKLDSFDKSKHIVLIVDTCGDRADDKYAFGYDISKWNAKFVWPNYNESNKDGYMAWSLRNVLLRGEPTENDRFYLNPISLGLVRCRDTHRNKASSFIKKKTCRTNIKDNMTVAEAIAVLDARADAYQEYLDANMIIDDEIAKLITGIQD